jgi:hypothetical protein
MLRNGFMIVLAVGIIFGGLMSPVRAATTNKVTAAAARQAALAQAQKRKHKHHHRQKKTVGLPTAALAN